MICVDRDGEKKMLSVVSKTVLRPTGNESAGTIMLMFITIVRHTSLKDACRVWSQGRAKRRRTERPRLVTDITEVSL